MPQSRASSADVIASHERTGRASASAAFQMKVVIGILAVVAVIVGALALVSQVRDLNTTVAVTKRELAAAQKRLARIEEELATLQAAQTRSGTVATPRPVSAGDLRGLQIDPDEADMIRDIILNQPGAGPEMDVVAHVGQIVQEVSPRRVPTELVAKVPKLKGLRYVLDAHWGIALIAASSNRVVAVVSPV